MKEVDNALKAVSNVDNVEINCDPAAYNTEVSLSGRLPDLTEGDWPYPRLPRGRISFDLLIPMGAQRELLRDIDRSPQTFTERFRVEIYYQYHLPVTVVRLIEPTSEPNPSNAVIIIRELLEREFKRDEQSLVDFQFMGPSPLHADFYLAAHSAASDGDLLPWDFDLIIEHNRGYDRYDFTFNRGVFANSEDALNDLLKGALQELDLYYLIVWLEREDA